MYGHSMNVKTFLNGKLAKGIYITQLQKFQHRIGLVCRLLAYCLDTRGAGKEMIVVIYVNGILFSSSSLQVLEAVKLK